MMKGRTLAKRREAIRKEGYIRNKPTEKVIQFPVAIAKGIHLFPSRTQKLSPYTPKVLGW